MALPPSGTITMTMVKTELGLASNTTLTLTDSRVRTLFGKPTGTIKLTDGYGKSNAAAYRPTAYNGTTGSQSGAYDGTGLTVDTATTTVGTSSFGDVSQIFSAWSPSASGKTGTLYINARYDVSSIGSIPGTMPSNPYVSYSTDNGSTWTVLTNSLTDLFATYSVSLTSITISSLLIKCTNFNSRGGSIKFGTDYFNNTFVDFTDMVFVG